MIKALPTREFCRAIGISPATIYRAWSSGEGPRFFYIGNRRYISDEAAREWLRHREQLAALNSA